MATEDASSASQSERLTECSKVCVAHVKSEDMGLGQPLMVSIVHGSAWMFPHLSLHVSVPGWDCSLRLYIQSRLLPAIILYLFVDAFGESKGCFGEEAREGINRDFV